MFKDQAITHTKTRQRVFAFPGAFGKDAPFDGLTVVYL
jgi:hypothetical protein